MLKLTTDSGCVNLVSVMSRCAIVHGNSTAGLSFKRIFWRMQGEVMYLVSYTLYPGTGEKNTYDQRKHIVFSGLQR